jgi:hypothetical protein
MLTGCGMFHQSYQAVAEKGSRALRWYKAPGEDLIKTVAVVRLDNRSGYPVPDFEATYTALFIERLQAEDGGLRIISAEDPQAPEFLRRLPLGPDGRIDNFELALRSRQHGVNAVVAAALIDVRDRRQERGIWWFKDVYDYIDITLDVEVYDSETAAKLIDERLTQAIEADIPLVLPSQPSAATLPVQVLEEFEKMIRRAGRLVADAVVVRSWVGVIGEVSDDRVMLRAGADVGLEAGDVLEVFDNRRVIQGVEDVRFFVPGLKIGEIEVVETFPDRVTARLVSDTPVWAGCTVKRKP